MGIVPVKAEIELAGSAMVVNILTLAAAAASPFR
jgi:hypothetical protein